MSSSHFTSIRPSTASQQARMKPEELAQGGWYCLAGGPDGDGSSSDSDQEMGEAVEPLSAPRGGGGSALQSPRFAATGALLCGLLGLLCGTVHASAPNACPAALLASLLFHLAPTAPAPRAATSPLGSSPGHHGFLLAPSPFR